MNPARTPHVDNSLKDRVLWGADATANYLDCSPDYVRKVLVKDPTCPVGKKGKRIFARRDELEVWSRFQPDNSNET